MRTCSICKNDLPETSEFFASRKRKTKISFQGVCRKCQKEYRKNHYEINKAKYISKASINKKVFVTWFEDLKKELQCEKCGEKRHWVLDFHHNDPSKKDGNVSSFSRKGNKKKLLEEIKKCKVLCANCHRDFHYKEKQAGDA